MTTRTRQKFRLGMFVLFWLAPLLAFATAIHSLEKIKLGNVSQWIYITGNDTHNPVLLILHGGPGFAMMPLFHQKNTALENYFTLVNWDQRGAGLSYDPSIPKKSMTLKQLVSDAHDLTLLLKTRFHQQKIYLLAHSSGTMIAMRLIQKYPEDYAAYISVGQVVSFSKNERGSYDAVLAQARAEKNLKAIKELQRIGRPDTKGDYKTDDGYDITEKWVEFFGGDIHDTTKLKNFYDEIEILYHGIYAEKKVSTYWLQGINFSQSLFDDPAMKNFNLESDSLNFQVPIYFLSGKYDTATPTDLVKNYYKKISAPKKTLIEFNHSAHFPFYEESEKFNDILINRVLSEKS